MAVFKTLLRREYWENRGGMVLAPVVTGSVIIFLVLLAILVATVSVAKINGQEFVLGQIGQFIENVSEEDISLFITGQLISISGVIGLVWFIVTFFYALGSLYDDRKDRSILFWRSMPVSDTQTVLSKLAVIMVISPAVAVAAMIVTQLILMIIGTVILLINGVSPWSTLWGNADLLPLWGTIAYTYVVLVLWCAPTWGWLLLASAWAKSKPFLWAIVPPVFVAIMQSSFNIAQYFNFRDNQVWEFIGGQVGAGSFPFALWLPNNAETGANFSIGLNFDNEDVAGSELAMVVGNLTDRLFGGTMLLYVVSGAALVALAIYIRKFRDEA